MPSIHLYFPETELKELKRRAAEKNLSLSEYVRHCIELVGDKPLNPYSIEEDIRFLRRGLEAHWKKSAPAMYEAAMNRPQIPPDDAPQPQSTPTDRPLT